MAEGDTPEVSSSVSSDPEPALSSARDSAPEPDSAPPAPQAPQSGSALSTSEPEELRGCGHAPASGEPQPWLNTLVSDLASLALFSGAGTVLGILTPLTGPGDVIGPLAAGVGLWGAGVERGKVRPPSAAVCMVLSGWAALVHVLCELVLLGPSAWGLPLGTRAALIAVVGAILPAIATRFDRGETAWRVAARNGPPTGFAPLAAAIAAWRPPTPMSYLLLVLLPLDLAARALSVGAILAYQLTASRLMPSACRYEPTCSRYGFRAYLKHSWIKATLLTAFRVLRCSPIGSGGYDPIPRPAPLKPGPLQTEDFIP